MPVKAARSSMRGRPPWGGENDVLEVKAGSAPTGHQEEVLWPLIGSRKRYPVGLTRFGTVCFSGRRFVKRSKSYFLVNMLK